MFGIRGIGKSKKIIKDPWCKKATDRGSGTLLKIIYVYENMVPVCDVT
jgi:hypothetical protein